MKGPFSGRRRRVLKNVNRLFLKSAVYATTHSNQIRHLKSTIVKTRLDRSPALARKTQAAFAAVVCPSGFIAPFLRNLIVFCEVPLDVSSHESPTTPSNLGSRGSPGWLCRSALPAGSTCAANGRKPVTHRPAPRRREWSTQTDRRHRAPRRRPSPARGCRTASRLPGYEPPRA